MLKLISTLTLGSIIYLSSASVFAQAPWAKHHYKSKNVNIYHKNRQTTPSKLATIKMNEKSGIKSNN